MRPTTGDASACSAASPLAPAHVCDCDDGLKLVAASGCRAAFQRLAFLHLAWTPSNTPFWASAETYILTYVSPAHDMMRATNLATLLPARLLWLTCPPSCAAACHVHEYTHGKALCVQTWVPPCV